MRAMTRLALSLALAALVGCSGSSTTAPPPPPPPSNGPPPADTPPPAPPPAALDLAQLGAPCGEGGVCAAPTECVRYYGIAGAKGPELSSCEIRCAGPDAKCPEGATCVTVADGPGQVCRPR
jgi:hypothetical protein